MIRRRKIFYGWWIVLASAIVNVICSGTLFYGFTVFFNPIRQTFGWGAAVTSVAFSVRGLETGFLDPIVGFLVDRMGPRKLMLCGWSIAGLGFSLMSRINSLWTCCGSFLVLATGMCFGSGVVINTAIAQWFVNKRSRAMALMYVGVGAGGLIVPLLASSIRQFGRRVTLIFVDIAAWVISIPLSSLMRHKPSQYGYLPDGETRATLDKPTNLLNPHSSSEIAERDSDSSAIGFTAREALRTRAFWLLSLVFLFQGIATSAINVHIVPYLESVQFPTTIAATVVTGMMLCSLIGRIGFGFLGDFANKRYLIAIALTLQTIGIFIFSLIDVGRTWLLIPFLLIYAPGFAGPIPLRPALQADYFGIRSFGTIFGLMVLISMLGGLASPIIAGWVFDVTGSYHLAWQLFALTTVPAIPLILLAKPPGAKRKA